MTMRRHVLPLALALLVLAFGPVRADEVQAAQQALNGAWQGDGMRIRFDIERLQANTNPDKPFQWQAFHLLNVEGRTLVFDIGPTRYIGLFRPDGDLSLTMNGVSREFVLAPVDHAPKP